MKTKSYRGTLNSANKKNHKKTDSFGPKALFNPISSLFSPFGPFYGVFGQFSTLFDKQTPCQALVLTRKILKMPPQGTQ